MIDALLLAPSCDLHAVAGGTPQLRMEVLNRSADPANNNRAQIKVVLPPPPGPTGPDIKIDFFAPYHEVGHRFDNLPTVDPATGVVTAGTPGSYLFQVRIDPDYIVGRLQVHKQIVTWWFGSDTITAVVDPLLSYAQPTIYALFKDDVDGKIGTPLEEVGDLTGHGFVDLRSSDSSVVEVTPLGRLRGLRPTTSPVIVTGTFLGKARELKVHVVDHGGVHPDLVPVRKPRLDRVADVHNLLFVGEGFRQEDRDHFDELVTRVTDQMFTVARHEPFGMLADSFNVFKAFTPSRQRLVTCGLRVSNMDSGAVFKGTSVPSTESVSSATSPEGKPMYTPRELVARVGPPLRNDERERPELLALWAKQSLLDFDPGRVDDDVFLAYKAQRGDGLLQTRDTFFGFVRGQRPGEREPGKSDSLDPPTKDSASEKLTKFIGRLYEFHDPQQRVYHEAQLDQRRHPPELVGPGFTSIENGVMGYLGGLALAEPPSTQIGTVWTTGQGFSRSKGLVVVLSNDALTIGVNLSLYAPVSLAKASVVGFVTEPAPPGELVKKMTRTGPPPHLDLDNLVNTVTHELGHSMTLGDEYEESNGDGTGATAEAFFDNVTSLVTIAAGSPLSSRQIDVDKVKWADLPLADVSSTILNTPSRSGNVLEVIINAEGAEKWNRARHRPGQIQLRGMTTDVNGLQLPVEDFRRISGMSLLALDTATGTIRLGGVAIPADLWPFGPGSALVLENRRLTGSQGRTVIEDVVRQHLRDTRTPLNTDLDHVNESTEDDHPIFIAGYSPPCKTERVVGVYEGGLATAGAHYRPTGACRMRTTHDGDEFCFVCKWLIVNRVDPGMLALLSHGFYPGSIDRG